MIKMGHLGYNFLLAGPTGDALNLTLISLRLGGRRQLWDSAGVKIINVL
jgi:hypothetical protein